MVKRLLCRATGGEIVGIKRLDAGT